MKTQQLSLMLLIAGATATITSCSSNDEAAQSEQTVACNKVTALLPEFIDEGATRTQISVDATDQITYRWAVGDVLGIFPDQGDQVSFRLSESSLSADGLSATFDGGAWSLKAGHSYYSYFPFSRNNFAEGTTASAIPVDYTGQQMQGWGDTSNAGQYDFNAAGATSSLSGNLSFQFVRLGAMLRIAFNLPTNAKYQSLVLSTTDNVIPVKGTVDLTADAIAYTPTEYTNTLTVNLNDASGKVGDKAMVYMMLPPMDLKTSSKTLTVTLNYDGKSTIYNLCTAGTETPNTPDFKADTRYKRDAVYASGDPEGTMSEGGDEKVDTHEYVDLGLPSGTLWATCNVGASSPEEYGLYFAWGETQGYTGDTSDGRSFDWASYKWMTSGESSWDKINKYTFADGQFTAIWYNDGTFVGDGKKTLDPEDDAATANWGSGWCMPTHAQQIELVNSSYTTTAWTTKNGVYGRLITSKTNNNTLFLPAAGYRNDSDLIYAGSYGLYWSSELDSNDSNNAWKLDFDSGDIYAGDMGNRYYGQSVRAVRSSAR